MFRVGCRALRVQGHAAFSTSTRVLNAPKPSTVPDAVSSLLSDLGAPPEPKRARSAPSSSSKLAAQPLRPQGGKELDSETREAAALAVLPGSAEVPLADALPSQPPTGPDPNSLPPGTQAGQSFANVPRFQVVPYTLHIHASRNNTLLTLTDPRGKVPKKGWVSAGLLKFRKSNRSSYEAGYQCAAYMFKRLAQEYNVLNGWQNAVAADAKKPALTKSAAATAAAAAAKAATEKRTPTHKIELTLKFDGFGPGRDAVYRALLTQEGAETAQMVRWIVDCTPIKIGGTRAKKTRRL